MTDFDSKTGKNLKNSKKALKSKIAKYAK